MSRLAVLFLLLTPLWGFAAQGDTQAVHNHTAHKSSSTASPDGLGADAVLDANGRLWVVTVRAGHVILRHSDDFGETFSAPVKVNKTPESVMSETEIHPQVAVGPQGRINVTWSHPLPGHKGINIRFASSSDEGRHFSKPITVNHDLTPTVHYIDTLAVDDNGRIWVAWIDGRARQAATAKNEKYRGFDLYTSWSDDDGKTFAPGHEIAAHSCECCRVALAPTPGGQIAAFFRKVYPGQIRDHAFAVLGAGQPAGKSHRVTFSGWKLKACPEQGPGLAIGADGVRHGVWFEASDGPTIWYGQLNPGHPPKHKRKIGGAGSSHADVATHDGTVWIAWNQIGEKNNKLMLRVSHDNGVNFDAPREIASTASATTSPQLLVHDGQAYVAWNTDAGLRLVAAPSNPQQAAVSVKPLSETGIPALLAPPKKGKRIIALWALYCVYCGPDMAALGQLRDADPDRLQLVTVATDNIKRRKDDIVKRLQRMHMTNYPAYAYSAGSPTRMNYRIAPNWGGVLPYTIVINADGARTAYVGQLSETQLQQIARF